MKLQVVSDLHLEFYKDHTFIDVKPAVDADVLVLAGDIGLSATAVERFKDWPVPVVYVHGNHEMYAGHDYGKTVIDLREACAGTQIHFLEQDALVFAGFPEVRILGTCLWTDYLLFGRPQQADCMTQCNETMADHSKIRSHGRPFMAKDAMHRHVKAKRWLQDQLDAQTAGTPSPRSGKTVVVTHHGCHWNSVAPRWRTSPVTAGFASDLTPLLGQADLWIHGHTHDSFDYQVDRCRVVVNPRGYPHHGGGYENRNFNPQLVIEL
jgi:predicted phosphodiesterase